MEQNLKHGVAVARQICFAFTMESDMNGVLLLFQYRDYWCIYNVKAVGSYNTPLAATPGGSSDLEPISSSQINLIYLKLCPFMSEQMY